MKSFAGIAIAVISLASCSSGAEQVAPESSSPPSTQPPAATPAPVTTTIAKASRESAVAVQKCIDAISTGMFADVLLYQDRSKLETFEAACEAAMTELEVDSGAQVGPTPINKLKLFIASRLLDVSKFKFDTLNGATPATYPAGIDLFQWEADMSAMIDAAR